MKVVVAGISGNQGKSTLSAHMLVPRMNGAKLLVVESINQDSRDLVSASGMLRGEEFKKIYLEMVMNDDLVVDVGASNSEAFFEGLASFNSGHDEVNLFIVPVVPGAKEQAESILTARMLAAMGVEKERIRVVFNRVRRDVSEEFPEIVYAAEATGEFIADPRCMVFENDIYADLADLKMSLKVAREKVVPNLNGIKDELRKKASSPEEYYRLVRMLNVGKKAESTSRQLDEAFLILCGGGGE
ncbi:hypothetical protein EQ826_09515 [Ectopseudomonas mendocina]|nr:StbB family protein [Pseudomonas mendocina]TRO27408.1 hypothetical protein EQ826_09515 [Pseudomonas mendocina]